MRSWRQAKPSAESRSRESLFAFDPAAPQQSSQLMEKEEEKPAANRAVIQIRRVSHSERSS